MCHLLLNIFFYKIGVDWISGSYCRAFRDGQLVDAMVSEVKKDPDGRPFAVIYFDDDAFNQYNIWLSELKLRGKIANCFGPTFSSYIKSLSSEKTTDTN